MKNWLIARTRRRARRPRYFRALLMERTRGRGRVDRPRRAPDRTPHRRQPFFVPMRSITLSVALALLAQTEASGIQGPGPGPNKLAVRGTNCGGSTVPAAAPRAGL